MIDCACLFQKKSKTFLRLKYLEQLNGDEQPGVGSLANCSIQSQTEYLIRGRRTWLVKNSKKCIVTPLHPDNHLLICLTLVSAAAFCWDLCTVCIIALQHSPIK